MSPFVGELLGTAVLILLGNGVVAGVLLNRSKAQNAGWIVITAGWALAVLCGVFVSKACGSADAHLNPAVTLGAAVSSGDFSKLPGYWAAQMIGAFLGACLVWSHYLPHWSETEDAGAKLACFSTGPAVRSALPNLWSEIVGTWVLVFVAWAIFRGVEPAAGLGPILVGSLVWGIGLSLGGTTGYAINPARDLGPRLAHALLPIRGKGPSDWGYAWIPVVGPLLGAVAGGLLIRFFSSGA